MIITLPRKALKYLDEEKIQIEIKDKMFDKDQDDDILEETRGLWGNKSIEGLDYQIKIRNEFERDLSE